MKRALEIAALGVLLSFGVACGGEQSATQTASTGSTPQSDEVGVLVYFTKDEAVAAAGRTVEGPAVARAAIEAQLEGPEGIETEISMTSAIPDGTELLDLDISDGVAIVDLNAAFESGGGSLSMQLRVAQVVFTLTQFETVDSVNFRIDGTPVESIGGEGVLVEDVDRSDFEGVTPLILVESPVPGEAVTSPLAISGMSNTFEATVRYAVTDGDGLIVDEGFTTATSGNGTYGTFTITSTFEVDRSGVGAVIAFEESAEDGSQINVYEVPVDIE